MPSFHAFQADRSKAIKAKAGNKHHLVQPKVKIVNGRIVKAAPVIKKAVAKGQAKAKTRAPKAPSVEEEYDDEFSGFSNTEDIVEPRGEDSSASSSEQTNDDVSEEASSDSPSEPTNNDISEEDPSDGSNEDGADDLLPLVPPENTFLIGNREKLAVLIRPVKKLALSGDKDANFLDATIESGHEDEVLRGIFASLFFRYHRIDQNTMRQYIIPERIPTKSALYQLVRERCKHWNTKFKTNIMKFYIKGVTETIAAMDNPELLSRVAKSDRRAFWGAIYDQNPQLTAKASCVGINGSVPIEEIFSCNHQSHIKWQRFIKTVFVTAADNAYVYRFLTNDQPKSKKICFKKWVGIAINPNLGQLNLGDIKEIPIKTVGIYD